ncbi:MAG: hypothetical protein VX278_08375 [Myxococcota bacterium]|nr:hypothetical protein [Myxococcota bacterium]
MISFFCSTTNSKIAEPIKEYEPSPTHFIYMPNVGHLVWNTDNDESTLTRGV